MLIENNFLESVSFYHNAEFDRSISLIANDSDFYSCILRVRNLTRLNRFQDAIEIISRLTTVADLDIDMRLELSTVSVFPYLGLRKNEQAFSALDSGKRLLQFEHSIDLETELYYIEAAAFFATDRYVEARRSANMAIAASDDIFGSSAKPNRSTSHAFHHRAKALQLTAVIISSQEKQYHEQGRLIRQAIKDLENAPIPDLYTSAYLKMNLSYYVRDLDSLPDLPLLEHEPWPASLNWLDAEIDRSVAWTHALTGNFSAFEAKIRIASSKSDSLSFRLLAVADRNFCQRYAFGDTIDRSCPAEWCMSDSRRGLASAGDDR